CLEAAQRCWNANPRGGATLDLAWWLLAAVELNRAAPDQSVARAALDLGAQLVSLQVVDFAGAQKLIRGFWRAKENSPEPYSQAVDSALPALALLELAKALPNHPGAARWRDAVRLHFDEYVLPVSVRSAYRIIPVGVYYGSPTEEHYRPLEGQMSYRYFLPVRKQFWWVGTTSHLECYALALATAAKMFGKTEYRDLAYRQLEWVMGANPFAACLMTGEGMRHPYPHSRYIGLIPGGILNGIAGNVKDEPVLDVEYGFDWRTTEYWSPHNAYYIWALSVLES
ncbi:MAG: glycoside hydrolase family 9 protein, partial [Acidobacteria bacterium]|nr:glycoside hydrolase family 9 protein [Acidobacteriota bacterium]